MHALSETHRPNLCTPWRHGIETPCLWERLDLSPVAARLCRDPWGGSETFEYGMVQASGSGGGAWSLEVVKLIAAYCVG